MAVVGSEADRACREFNAAAAKLTSNGLLEIFWAADVPDDCNGESALDRPRSADEVDVLGEGPRNVGSKQSEEGAGETGAAW